MTDVTKTQASSFTDKPSTTIGYEGTQASQPGAASHASSFSSSTEGASKEGKEGKEVSKDAKGGQAGAAIVTQAKTIASHMGTEASDLVKGQIAQRGEQSANELGDVARVLRDAGKQLGDNVAAPYVGKAADQIDRVSQFVRKANPADIAESITSIARKEPLLFLGGAFALGILGARFLKSSARREASGASDAPGGGASRTGGNPSYGSSKSGASAGSSSGYQGGYEARGKETRP